MGQQQILFVILAVCIIGIAVSVGVISMSGHAVTDNSALVEQDLKMIAKKAQDYVALQSHEGSERISLFLLSRLPDAMGRLGCSSSNAHGDFFVKKSDNLSSMQIVGVGAQAGHDQRRPLRLVITVWADSTSLAVLD